MTTGCPTRARRVAPQDRRFAEDMRDAGERDPGRGPVASRTGSRATCSGDRRDLHRPGRPAHRHAPGRRPDGRPADSSCRSSASSRRRTRRSGSSCSSPASMPTRSTWPTTASSCARRMASGLTAPRIVAERTIAQLERMLATPIEQAVVPSLVTVARDEDREAIRDVIRDEVYPADRRLPRGAPGRLPRRVPARERDLVGARRRRPVPDPDPALDDARPRPLGGPPDRPATSSRRSRPSDARSPEGRRLRRRHGCLPGVARARRGQPGAISRGALIARATEDIERAIELAPRMFRRLPVSQCRVIPVEEYKERDAPFAYYYPPSADTTRPGTYYVNTFDLPSRSSRGWRRRPTTRPSRATTSRSRSRARTRR